MVRVPVPPTFIRRDHRPDTDPPTTWFEIPLADCPLFQFTNELGITAEHLGDESPPPHIEELAVFVS